MEPKEIRKRIRKLITESGPMKRQEIAASFSKANVSKDEVSKILNKLISLQVLYPCSGQRVWDQDESEMLIGEAKRLIREKNRSRAELPENCEN